MGLLLPLFRDEGWWARFVVQHGPVREGLGIVISGWILEATKWDVRYDSLWVSSVLLLAAMLALRVKWKMTGTIGLRDSWIPLFCMSLGQFETVLSVPQAAHSVVPLALILLAANVWLSPRPSVRYLGSATAGVMLTYTGFGLFAGGGIAVLLVARAVRHALEGERRMMWLAAVGVAMSAAGWSVFLKGYAFSPAVDDFRFPWDPWTDYVRFVLLMLCLPTGEIGDRLPHYVLGSALALVVGVVAARIAWVWAKHRPSLKDDVLVLLMASGLLFVAATAVGRVSIGPLGGTASRYLSLMVPMWLAVYFAAAMSRRKMLELAALVCLGVLTFPPYVSILRRPLSDWPGTVGMTHSALDAVMHYGTGKAAWADAYLSSGSWEAAGAAVRQPIHPNPEGSDFDAKLRFLRERKLSFFAGDPGRGDYMPWLADDRFRRIVTAQMKAKIGAGDGDRTRDIELGKLAFYR